MLYCDRKRSTGNSRNLKLSGGARRRSGQRKRQLLQQPPLWHSNKRRSRRGKSRRPKDNRNCGGNDNSNRRPFGDFSNSSNSNLHK